MDVQFIWSNVVYCVVVEGCMQPADDIFSQPNMRAYRLTIFTQLRQAVETMHRPEEMFQWLASVIVQSFDVAIVQFWTCENGFSDQPSAWLRAMVSQDSSQPASLVSEKVAMIIEHISKGQHIFLPLPIEQVFPQYLASLLRRHGLSYCTYCLINKNVRFAPVEYTLSHERTPAGLTFIALLFLRHYPRQDLISTVSIILEQALVVAENRRLLLPITANSARPSPPQEAIWREPLSAFYSLIPRPKQNVGLMLSSNPFASPVTISDKQALRLYQAIDGRKNVAELCGSVGMSINDACIALQTLLNLQRIEIYTAEDRPADTTLLFKKP